MGQSHRPRQKEKRLAKRGLGDAGCCLEHLLHRRIVRPVKLRLSSLVEQIVDRHVEELRHLRNKVRQDRCAEAFPALHHMHTDTEPAPEFGA